LEEGMEVREEARGKGRRKVGMLWWVESAYSRWRWSKMLRSRDWTTKRMQRGSWGEDLEGP